MCLSEEAIKFIKKNKKDIVGRFINKDYIKLEENPFSIFMAGSPGAGKTEFSKNYIKKLDRLLKERGNDGFNIIRMDPDDIRIFLPGYDGKNSHLFQGAVSLVVNKVYDIALKKKYNILIDGTFSKFEQAKQNIKRSIDKDRIVRIFYIYQDPIKAWEFSKKRESEDGRSVPINTFVDDFFDAKDNVNKIKKIFTNSVEVVLVKKDYKNSIEDFWIDIDDIDSYLKMEYNKKTLIKQLSNYKIC